MISSISEQFLLVGITAEIFFGKCILKYLNFKHTDTLKNVSRWILSSRVFSKKKTFLVICVAFCKNWLGQPAEPVHQVLG